MPEQAPKLPSSRAKPPKFVVLAVQVVFSALDCKNALYALKKTPNTTLDYLLGMRTFDFRGRLAIKASEWNLPRNRRHSIQLILLNCRA
jgi:hypothetical protein